MAGHRGLDRCTLHLAVLPLKLRLCLMCSKGRCLRTPPEARGEPDVAAAARHVRQQTTGGEHDPGREKTVNAEINFMHPATLLLYEALPIKLSDDLPVSGRTGII